MSSGNGYKNEKIPTNAHHAERLLEKRVLKCYNRNKQKKQLPPKESDLMFGAIIGDIAGSVYEWHNIKTKDFPLFRGDENRTETE